MTAINARDDGVVIERRSWVRLDAQGVVVAAASFRRNDLADELRARAFVEEAMTEGHMTRSARGRVRLGEPLPEEISDAQ